jgi:hypothetical protein
MNSTNNISVSRQNIGGAALVLSNPLNIVEFLVFYSPVVLATILFIIPTSVMDAKGAIYLALLIGVCFLRIFIYWLFGKDPYYNDNTVCTMVKYGDYGNSYVSIFVIAFTFMYVCTPMFYNNTINYMVLSLLLFYLILTIGIFFYRNCIKNKSEVFVNILLGALMGTIIPVFFYMGQSSKYLFFNEFSNKEICSMPSKQTFKCNVYKNGQLIA